MIILDTDVLIEIMDRRSAKGRAILEKIRNFKEEVATTPINLHEIFYGLLKFKKLNAVKKILELNVVGYDREDAFLSSKLEVELEKKGKKIARLDCMIAAIAINRNAKLYTLNLRHFEKFKSSGLKILI